MMRAFDASAGETIASAWGRLEEEKSGLPPKLFTETGVGGTLKLVLTKKSSAP